MNSSNACEIIRQARTPHVKPPRTEVHKEAIPDELTRLKQWIVWKYEWRPDKAKEWTKPLYQVKERGKKASSTDPSTWAAFEDAYQSYLTHRDIDGIGFVFTPEDPYFGIDLDHCLNGGKPEAWAQEILNMFPGTYQEITPSGTGLHIIGKGKLPDKGKKKGDLEAYDRGRYFTMTGVLYECHS